MDLTTGMHCIRKSSVPACVFLHLWSEFFTLLIRVNGEALWPSAYVYLHKDDMEKHLAGFQNHCPLTAPPTIRAGQILIKGKLALARLESCQ